MKKKLLLLVALIATVVVGCSSQNDAEPVDGSSTGGQGGSGGQPAASGRTGSAGTASGVAPGASTGGSASPGGAPSAGGTSSPGGTPASGGAFGLGGSSGAGGSTAVGAGGGPNAGGASPSDGGSNPGVYRPCPTDGTPCQILPFGDSITWGVGDEANAGYRGPFFGLAVAAQKKITFTGSLSNGPTTVSGQTFPKKNEGHSGYGISTVTQYSNGVAGIATLIPTPAFASGSGGPPNIILMMIGTNDTGNSTAAVMTDRLAALMDKIIAAAPDALLVVAKITPLSRATAVINSYNGAIPGLVDARAAAGKHVMLADMNAGFASTMIGSDGIHPNNAGYKFMADRWYSVVGPLLPN